MNLKKLLSVFICAVMLISLLCGTCSAAHAEENGGNYRETDVLTQLGLLGDAEPASQATKQMLYDGLKAIYGGDYYSELYFAGQELSAPLLYGQAAMVLVDILGYTDKLKIMGYDTKSPSSYILMANDLKLTPDSSLTQYSELTVAQYARMLYFAIAKTALFEPAVSGTSINYETTDKTLLSDKLGIKTVEGVVTGADTALLDSRGGGSMGYININGITYVMDEARDKYGYLGRTVEAYVNEEENAVCALVVTDDNVVTELVSDDIESAGVSSVSYYDNTRRRTLKLSDTVDVMYNRELLSAFTPEDLTLPDSTYEFIDNNGDGEYDVVLIERYSSYIIEEMAYSLNTALLKNGTIIEFTDYLDEGYRLYDAEGNAAEPSVLARSQVLSILESKDGNYTNMVFASHQENGTIEEMRDGRKYITVNGTEYECTEQFINKENGNIDINVGDYVTLSFDFLGRVVYVTVGTTGSGVAYLLNAYTDEGGECGIKVLDEDGTTRHLKLKPKMSFNGGSGSAEYVVSELKNGAETDGQLIMYSQNSDGLVASIETAVDAAALGSRGNGGFSLDFDHEANGELRALLLNDKRIVGSKYVIREDTVVFHVCTNDERENRVQLGPSIPTQTPLKLKLYNVNSDYEVEYAVLETTRDVGGWVDWWGDCYMLDSVYEAVNSEGDVVYRVDLYKPDGTVLTLDCEDGSISTNEWNILSEDKRAANVPLTDLPRGSVLMISSDFRGLKGIAVQFMPHADGSDIYFEAKTDTAGNEYGITPTMFNGEYIESYGVITAKTRNGLIINSHTPTADETGTFPMEEWNRTIPVNTTDTIVIYDSSCNAISVDTASSILPGDRIFMKRMGTTYNGIYIYR